MKAFRIDVSKLSHPEYLKTFGKLIDSAYIGMVLACLGWFSFWLDHIPSHALHTHMITRILFLVALWAGLYGTWIMFLTGNRMGTKKDRILLFLEVTYTITASLSGLAAFFIFPPH